jgi:hypothetical protein
VKRPAKNLVAILRGALGIGLFYYVVSTIGGWSFLQSLFLTPWLPPALAALMCFGIAIESKRMGLLFHSHDMRLSFNHGCKLVVIGTFFNFCLPGGTGGDVVKLYYLASENHGRGIETATVLLVDRLVALISLLFLIIGLALLNLQLVVVHAPIRWLVSAAVVGAISLSVVGVFSLSKQLRASRMYTYVLTRMPFHNYVERVSDALYKFREYKKALLSAVLISIVGHLALGGMYIAMASVFVPEAPPVIACLLALLGMLANALPITPGGLGVGEAAFNGLFRLVGYAGGAQLILAWRIAMVPVCFLGCILYMLGVRRGQFFTKQSCESTVVTPSSEPDAGELRSVESSGPKKSLDVESDLEGNCVSGTD